MKTATFPTLAVLFAVPIVAVFGQAGNNNADHQEMMAKLKITSPLRPGPAGRLNADGSAPPNFANYDESKATAKSPVPPLLAMNDGRKITTPAMWQERRKELFEIFDREIYGRVPEAREDHQGHVGSHGHHPGHERQYPDDHPYARRSRRSHVLPGHHGGHRGIGHDARQGCRQSAGDHPVGRRARCGRAGGPAAADHGAVAAALTLTAEQAAAIQPLLEKAQQDLAATPTPRPAFARRSATRSRNRH